MITACVRRTLLGFCFIGMLSASVSAAEWRRGIITGMDGGRIVLTNRDESAIIAYSSSTLVSLNGRPARASALSVGDVVLVMYLIQGGNLPTAQRVEAYRPTP